MISYQSANEGLIKQDLYSEINKIRIDKSSKFSLPLHNKLTKFFENSIWFSLNSISALHENQAILPTKFFKTFLFFGWVYCLDFHCWWIFLNTAESKLVFTAIKVALKVVSYP